MLYTIGKLARKFNISRSTLLYYDSIGLLCPTKRGSGNYRIYSNTDCERLEQIAMYRRAGLSLKQVKEILNSARCGIEIILEAKIEEINNEISLLRQQQQIILGFLKSGKVLQKVSVLQKDVFIESLKSAGFNGRDQWRLHNHFENDFPEAHRAFLQVLGLTVEQISKTRTWAQGTDNSR